MKLMLSKSPVFAVLAFNLLRVSCDSTKADCIARTCRFAPLECLMAIDRSVQEWPKDFICDIDLVPKVELRVMRPEATQEKLPARIPFDGIAA